MWSRARKFDNIVTLYIWHEDFHKEYEMKIIDDFDKEKNFRTRKLKIYKV